MRLKGGRMKITWIIGGLYVSHIGGTNVGKTVDVPDSDAHSLVKQGIAKYADDAPEIPENKTINIFDSYSRDELVVALMEKGIDPPDKANKTDLKKLLMKGGK